MWSSIGPAKPGLYIREAECGCYSEVDRAEDGELIELRVQVCETHMNIAFDELELRVHGEKAQLTLPLPSSADGQGERQS